MSMAGAGDPRFHALLSQIGELHDKKQEDYGSDNDPFANVRGSQEWGISPWVGALLRAGDKVHRLQQFAQKGVLANESAEDSMMDIAVYALIALVLYREESEATQVAKDIREAQALALFKLVGPQVTRPGEEPGVTE